MFDVIGDIHGHGDRLEALLKKLGYQLRQGAWRHPERTLISVGDLIDRGPQQRKTVDIIRAMQDAGQAQVILGNHELNAVAWTLSDGNGGFLRAHNANHTRQHAAFLAEAEQDKAWYASTLAWFRSLPVYLDLPALRVVHACWHAPSKAIIDAHSDAQAVLTEAAWIAANSKGHALYDAIEVMNKGWEVSLPPGYSFVDKGDHRRFAIRTQWWRTDTQHYRDLALGVEPLDTLPDGPIEAGKLPGYDQHKPLFIGHYWMRGRPQLQSPQIACVDWSVADPSGDGVLAAYRFDGEQQLSNDKFVWV
ncbi:MULTISPECIES: metallophosphoesterase [Idiomarinaceae]|uniref:Metallophosphoesterase n=1 Tax=Pseudidiomarina fusca TaxID=2965078 RepID=A0ABU3KVU1_9GAMM|nr:MULTISPECIES: metallophosphoesterase [Idiomarinaceae]MDT7525484.1 metallophosphoesterase [Pseudidiomarina sp. GXY010]MRJ42266.1 metallophosphoesterase [Idiomarina sp. FeN1]NCU57391.1 metallophosphoesterase [Idiomarina sp. FenA--70]NCU60577.1 metallophosphoesterase [Idiomarina sp. FenBw--71]UUN14756.1 metallophosphoesterase [Idiomarina loihiensis]